MAASEQDFMTMTDEEFQALPDDYFDNLPSEEGDSADPEAALAADGAAEESPEETEPELEEPETKETEEIVENETSSGTDDVSDDADTADNSDSNDSDDDSDGSEPTDSDENKKSDEAPVNYEAAYKELLSSFKANGKDMKVDNVDEARRLMQMGANYNKKMQGLKPNLRILKTLENANISEDKLNYLIDLDKKDPSAIARLVKESGIEPLDLDLEQGDNYTAPNYAANETEMALDAVISEIKDSPHYSATLDLVAKQWDGASKQQVVKEPQLMKVLTDHMASGVFQLINTELEKQQMLGQLNGMSDLEAYRNIGDAIQARNGFDHLFQPEQGQRAQTPEKPTPSKIAEDSKRNDKRRAAGSSKTAASSPSADFNPLSMSDDDFEKQFPG
jgi:hypothetical protein